MSLGQVLPVQYFAISGIYLDVKATVVPFLKIRVGIPDLTLEQQF